MDEEGLEEISYDEEEDPVPVPTRKKKIPQDEIFTPPKVKTILDPDSLKEPSAPTKKPNHDNEHYYLKEKILQTIMTSYFEDKKELENEIEELQEKLDGKDMVSQEQYDSKVKELKSEIKEKDNEIEKLEQKLKDKEEYYKLKLSATEQRMRGKLEMERKIELSREEIIEY